jgi:hypothetical protein
VVGIFSDSWKKQLMNRVERKRLRNSLYSELGLNLANMLAYRMTRRPESAMAELPAWTYSSISRWLRREVYDQALKESPVLFHELKEATPISQFYSAMSVIDSRPVAEQLERLALVRKVIAEEVKVGRLVRRKMHKHHALRDWESPYSHPVLVWLRKKYHAIEYRNLPKDGRGRIYGPTDTILKKIRALWNGVPEERPMPQ